MRGWVNVAESVRKLKIGSKERLRIIFVTYKIIIIIENYKKLVIIVTYRWNCIDKRYLDINGFLAKIHFVCKCKAFIDYLMPLYGSV